MYDENARLFESATRGDQDAPDQLLQRHLPHLGIVGARASERLQDRERPLLRARHGSPDR